MHLELSRGKPSHKGMVFNNSIPYLDSSPRQLL